MFSWIGANLSTILISIVLIATVTFISLSLIHAHYLLWAQVLSQKFFYTLLHSLCKYLL